MMRTTFDQDSLLFSLLNVSALTNTLTGKIYKGGSFMDFMKENIMIRSTTLTFDDVQAGVANVNIHVPDRDILGSKQPNTLRLKALSDIVQGLIEEYYGDDLSLYIDSMTTFNDLDGLDNHFTNYRIRFTFINQN